MREGRVFVAATLLAGLGYGCQFVAGVAGLEATEQSTEIACKSAADCPGRYCTDGFCCDVPDCGECHSCGVAGKGGKCEEVNDPCGGDCANGEARPTGICTAGTCAVEPVSCGNYTCNDEGTACNEECARNVPAPENGCAPNTVCTSAPEEEVGHCDDCGWAPPAGTMCNNPCESCAVNVCTTTCDTPSECAAPIKLDASKGATAILLCKDQCNDITVTCSGGNPCEVVCEEGGCNNLTLVCDINGACKLTCQGASCVGAKVTCGTNQCTAECDAGATVEMDCKDSCGCAKPGCK